jgi:hypothetical protein
MAAEPVVIHIDGANASTAARVEELLPPLLSDDAAAFDQGGAAGGDGGGPRLARQARAGIKKEGSEAAR